MIGIYEEFAAHTAAIPVVAGRKSRIESFAGELLSCIMGSVSTYLPSHSSPLHSTLYLQVLIAPTRSRP